MYNTSVISGTTEDHTIEWHYYYDHAGRLLSVENQVDEQGLFEMFSYKYNELGQVIEKIFIRRTSWSTCNRLIIRYNIRGWLTNINQSNLQNDNSIIQLDQELEPDEKVYGIKFDTIYLDTEYEPGDTVTGDNVHYAFTESKRLLVCNINDTSITREISLNETAVFTFNEYRTDSLKFIRLKELTNDDFYILFHATAFDAFQSQSYIIDSLLKIVNIDLNNQGVSDENVREQALDEFRTFAQQRIGIIYFNEDSDDLFGMDLLYNEGFDELNGTPQYNGNISGIKWQVGRTERIERGYGFQYTGKNWLADASYGERDDMNWNKNMGRYNVYDLDYDKNGNITQLKRKGWYNDEKGYEYRNIDLLSYTYNGNQLQAVER
ncbi:MAG: hypothetical protein U5Q03_17940 [Bacteroidota bacterium]|nr:hypothetical protein [Bacteroidota bacterium]